MRPCQIGLIVIGPTWQGLKTLKQMELYFVRHGETEYNKHHKLMGQKINAPLDALGKNQALEVLDKIPSDVSVIFSSPLLRAKQTAELIANKLGLPITVKKELTERDFGTLSGKSWDEIDKETELTLSERDEKLNYDYSPYGGESVFSVKTRLEKFLEEIRSLSPAKAVVVTHFGIISIMNKMFHVKESHKLSNATVHKFEI